MAEPLTHRYTAVIFSVLAALYRKTESQHQFQFALLFLRQRDFSAENNASLFFAYCAMLIHIVVMQPGVLKNELPGFFPVAPLMLASS
ncbi:hypothetical protein HV144_13050 [Citrobacter freundii]|nr:hypothetical protein [Citrobacter freundii]